MASKLLTNFLKAFTAQKTKTTHRFVQDPDNRWYIDLPEWPGPRAALEMVSGADDMLNILAQGENEVYVEIDIEPFEGYEYELTLDHPFAGGGQYTLTSDTWGYNFPVWLCGVIYFVFHKLPKKIYIK